MTDEPAAAPAAAMAVREAHTFIHKTSFFESVIHLLKANLGAGIFAMGSAFQDAGLILGFCGTLFLGFICAYNAHLLVMCAQMIKLKLNLDYLPNFPETVELCFKHGPLWIRKCTTCVRKMVKWSIISTQLGFCSIYILFVSRTAQAMLVKEYDFLPKDIRVFICMVSLLLVLTALIPTLKILTPLSLASNFLLISGMIITVVICAVDGFPPISSRPYVANYTTWPIFYGITLFAFEGIAIVIPLHNEMKNPQYYLKWYGVLNTAFFIVILSTATMGFVGYLKFGEDIKESVSLNFEDDISKVGL